MVFLTRHRRAILIGFGVLDALLFVRLLPQITWPSYVFDDSFPLWTVALEICRPVLLASLVFSALGLVLAQKWAIILSCIQFPFRFVYMFLSFGFIGLLVHVPYFPASYFTLMIIAIILECIRLIITIAVQPALNISVPLTGDGKK